MQDLRKSSVISLFNCVLWFTVICHNMAEYSRLKSFSSLKPETEIRFGNYWLNSASHPNASMKMTPLFMLKKTGLPQRKTWHFKFYMFKTKPSRDKLHMRTPDEITFQLEGTITAYTPFTFVGKEWGQKSPVMGYFGSLGVATSASEHRGFQMGQVITWSLDWTIAPHKQLTFFYRTQCCMLAAHFPVPLQSRVS